MRRILVYLANGVQGGAAVRQAVSRGHFVRALVRDPSRSDELRKLGVEVIAADLEDRDSLDPAHRGIDHAVIQMPPRPLHQVAAMIDNAIDAIRRADIQGVVVRMGSGKPSIPSDAHSFPGNQIVEDRMRASGLPFAIVRATMYLDNFLKPETREEISTSGVIRQPLGTRHAVAWTSTDDCARAALTLVENATFSGDHLVSGAAAVDGDGLAAAFSGVLGKAVRFENIPLDRFEQGVDRAMGPGMGKRLSALYRFLEARPDEAERILARPFEPALELRDFRPVSIETWIDEHRCAFSQAPATIGETK